MSLFKTNTTNDYSEPTRVNNVHRGGKKPRKPKKKKLLEDNIIKNVRNLFKLKKNAAIKDRKKKFITNQ